MDILRSELSIANGRTLQSNEKAIRMAYDILNPPWGSKYGLASPKHFYDMLRMCPDYMLGLFHGEVLAGTLRGAPLLVYKDGQVSLVRSADEIPSSFEAVTKPWREKVEFQGTPYLSMVDVTLALEYRGSTAEGKPLIDEFIRRAIEELFGHEHAFTMTPRIVSESLRFMHRRNGAEGPVRTIENFRPGYRDPHVDVMHYPLKQ